MEVSLAADPNGPWTKLEDNDRLYEAPIGAITKQIFFLFFVELFKQDRYLAGMSGFHFRIKMDPSQTRPFFCLSPACYGLGRGWGAIMKWQRPKTGHRQFFFKF